MVNSLITSTGTERVRLVVGQTANRDTTRGGNDAARSVVMQGKAEFDAKSIMLFIIRGVNTNAP